MKFIAKILTESLGYTSALLCLGLSDICSIAFKAATEEWDQVQSMDRLKDQVESIEKWQDNVGHECKLIYLLLPPVPWQDPREVFNGLWLNQFNPALGKVDITSFLNKSAQMIDVCNKIADRTYYEAYREMWRKKQNEGGFALWCLKKSGRDKLQTCRAYNLQNIHYDYNLLRNLYFSHGELYDEDEVDGIRNIENALKNQYLYIGEGEIYHIRQLSLHKYATGNQKKYWLLDAQAQLFKQRLADEKGNSSIENFVKAYEKPTIGRIKHLLDVDLNLIKTNDAHGTQRLVGDKLKTVFDTFSPLTLRKKPATGAFANRLKEISSSLVAKGVAHDNTFKFLEQVMIIIARAAHAPHQDLAQIRLLNYERTAVVLLLDNLVGLSFFRMPDKSTQEKLLEFFNEGPGTGFEPVPWTSGRINREKQFYIGSRRFNDQFIFDYCIGELIGVVEELRKKYLKKKSQGAEELLQNKESDLMTCCEYENKYFVQRYVALLPTQKTQSLQSTAPTALRTGSDDWDTEYQERTRMVKLQNKKKKKKMEKKELEELEKKYGKERDTFVGDHQEHTSSQDAYSSQEHTSSQEIENDEDDDATDAAGSSTSGGEEERVERERETKSGRGGKRTRKRRKSKKPRKTKSKRFRKKKKHTRKRRYKKKRRKTRR